MLEKYVKHAARYAPYSSLETRPVSCDAPYRIDFETSSTTAKFVLVSASYCFTKYLSVRAYSRQSIRRMSSPGMYCRCSAKSVDEPRCGARCRPLMNPSTTVRASKSRFPIFARTGGSMRCAPGTADVVSIWVGIYSLCRPEGAKLSLCRPEGAKRLRGLVSEAKMAP